MTLEHHKKACRALRFSKDGIHLYTASKDKSIQVVDLNTGSVKQKIKAAHRYKLVSEFAFSAYVCEGLQLLVSILNVLE